MAADAFAALNKACIQAFGSAVSYQQGAAAPFAVRGIVTRDTDESRHQDGVYARLFVNMADFSSRPDHGDVATIDGVAYAVFDVAIDTAGGAVLSLREST